jgi:hypothetical protein
LRISTEFDTPLPPSACLLRQLRLVLSDGRADGEVRFDLHSTGVEGARQTDRHDLSLLRAGCTLRTCRTGESSKPRPRQLSCPRRLCVKGRFGWRFVQSRTERRGPAGVSRTLLVAIALAFLTQRGVRGRIEYAP